MIKTLCNIKIFISIIGLIVLFNKCTEKEKNNFEKKDRLNLISQKLIVCMRDDDVKNSIIQLSDSMLTKDELVLGLINIIDSKETFNVLDFSDTNTFISTFPIFKVPIGIVSIVLIDRINWGKNSLDSIPNLHTLQCLKGIHLSYNELKKLKKKYMYHYKRKLKFKPIEVFHLCS